MPLITAIVPTYKRPEFLKRAVNSILAQSFPHFIVLISDNASGRETEEVLEQLKQQDERVHVLKQPKNVGAVANFQIPLMQVTTPYVCFLPDDDLVAPDFFESVMPYFTQYPEIAFCGGGGGIIDGENNIQSIESKGQTIPECGYYEPPRSLFTYYDTSFGIAFPSLIFKTALLQKLGGFDLRIRNGGDEYLISQLTARYPVYLLTNRMLYFGYQHDASLSAQLDYPLFEREAKLLHEKVMMTPLTPEEKEKVDAFFIKRRLKILSNAYRHFINLREFKTAGSYAKKILALSPSFRWRLKLVSCHLFKLFPFLLGLQRKLQSLERYLRKS